MSILSWSNCSVILTTNYAGSISGELGVLKDIAASKDAFKVLQENEYVRYDDLPLETRDGQSIAVEFVSNVYLVDHHKVIQCNIRDITEQKAVELARQESEKRLRRFYESGMLGVIYWNMDGNITDANDKFLEMVGYSREELTAGRIDWVNMTPSEHRHLDEASARELKATGINKEPFEKEYMRKDGTRVPILVAGAMLDEACFNGVAFVLDITARKQGEAALEAHRRHLEEMVQERTAALRRSQHLLNDTQRISKVGGWEFDVSTRRVFWTDEVYRMHGVSEDYDPSNPEQDIEFYAPEDRKRITDAFQRAVAQGEPYDLELQLVPAQGNRLWVRTTGQAESENGKVVRVFGNILDITETKNAQAAIQDANATLEKRVAERTEELRQSEERIRLALKNAPVSVAVQNRDLVYTWAYNQRTRRSDEIVGKTDADLFAPEDVSRILEEKRKVLETGTELHVQHWLTSNGKRLFLDLHYEPMRDSAGEITGIGIAVVDLTEQKLAEDALASDHALLDTLLVQAPIGFTYLDRELRYVLINEKLAELNGIAAAAHIGKRIHEIVPTLAAAVEEVCNQVLATGQPVKDHEFSGETALAPGVKRYWNESWYPVRDGAGEIVSFGVIVEEITDRKKAEEVLKQQAKELEDANRELESFSYSISHDLKAPLRAIDGYFRMFLKKYGSTLDDDGARLINVIRVNNKKMGLLIDDLLSFSKVLKSSMTLSEIDMDKLAGEVWDDIRAAHQERDLEFRITNLLPGFGDSALIKQALSNLISNAVKFTKSRKPGIIEMSSYADPGEVVYRVKDNGIGFDMAFYNKLFGVFQRLHGDEEYEGTGVGLAIVQRIIHRHGGRVWAEGEVDKGATFYFTLPVQQG